MEIVENNKENSKLEFADFCFDLEEKILSRGFEKISLPPKTCDLLAFLLQNRGRLLSKEEIFSNVWTDTVVEEANLSHHIAVLRKTFGENSEQKFIETIPRRGYRFVAPVHETSIELVEVKFKEKVLTHTIISEEIETDSDEEIAKKIKDEKSQIIQIGLSVHKSALRLILLSSIFVILVTSGFLIYKLTAFSKSEKILLQPLEITRVSDKNVSISVISPDGKLVVYAQNSNIIGGGGLYVRQLDTNREIKLLEPSDERIFADIKFSFDGSMIYFIAFEKDTKMGAIYRIPILGGTRQKIVELKDNATSFAVSPDNRQIVFYRYSPEGDSLISIPLDNPTESEKVLLKFNRMEKDFGGFLSWSSDGRFIALTGSEKDFFPNVKVYGFDVQKNVLKPFSEEIFENIGKQVFSSDGQEIYFVGKKQNAPQKIHAVNTQDGNLRTLPLESNRNSFYGSYGLSITQNSEILTADVTETRADVWISSINGDTKNARRVKIGDSDGKRGLASLPNGYLLYTAVANGNSDIWKMHEDGTEIQPLTNDTFIERYLSTSKDGRFVVYSSNAGNGWHLFRLNVNEPGEIKQLTFGEAIDSQPNISPDGNWIVYISEEKERAIIKKISINGGEPVVLNDVENSVYPVFSPNGEKIAFEIISSARSLPGTIAIMSANGGKIENMYPVADFNYRNMSNPLHWTPDGMGILFTKINTNISNVWRLDLKTAQSTPLTNFSDEGIYNFVVSADAKQIYLSRGIYLTNTVLIKNFQDLIK